jgi:hypothetical protein
MSGVENKITKSASCLFPIAPKNTESTFLHKRLARWKTNRCFSEDTIYALSFMEMVFIIYWNVVFIVRAVFKKMVFSFEP